MILTRKEWHAIQVVPPLCGDFDSLAFAVLCFWREACHLRVGNEFLDVLRMDCVQNRVEVCPVREPIFRIGVLHVLHDALVQSPKPQNPENLIFMILIRMYEEFYVGPNIIFQ